MAGNYSQLKSDLQAVVKENHEEYITGQRLQNQLIAMINSLGTGYQYMGIATPTTNPGTPDEKVFYIASAAGTYSNFGSPALVVNDGEVAVFKWDTAWHKEVTGAATAAQVTELGQKVVGDFYQNTATEFATLNPCIAELFLNPYYLNGITSVDFRTYLTNSYLISNSWSATIPITTYFNGDVIPITVTTAGGNASLGDVVGYVIFKDIDTFRDTSIGSLRNPLNLDFVQRIQNSPSIAAYLQIKQEKKIVFYKYPTTITQVPIYENCIKELFIAPNLIASAKSVSISSYNNGLYAYFGSTEAGGTVVFVAAAGLANYSNGDVIPIAVSTAGGGLSVGDIVGYVIFKDITTFKATPYTSRYALVDLSVVCDIVNAPTILSGQFITKEDGLPIYVPNASISQIAIYETCIEEIWVNSKFGNANKWSFRDYGNYGYLNYTESGKSFQCLVVLNNYANGDIVPLIVTTAGGNAALGDIVGYVIFKDIATFKATSYGSTNALLELGRAFDLVSNPKIWNAITTSPEAIEKMVADKIAFDIVPVIPSVIYAAVGVELNIYNDTIALSMDKGLNSPTNYIVRWACNKGTITSRGFRFTPQVSDIGDVSLTCYVYNIVGELFATKSITIKVVSGQLNSLKRVVFFGDSIGAGTATALYNDFNDSDVFSGTQPTMLGIRGTTPKYEAFGGARWTDFATAGRAAYRCQVADIGPIALGAKYTNNGYTWEVVEVNVTAGTGNILITRNDIYSSTIAPQVNGTLIPVGGGDNVPYTGAAKEAANPLWYNDAIDFAHYRNTLGLASSEKLDLVSFQLGGNGDEDNATLTQYISALYNAAIADNANCIFLIGLTPGSCNTLDAYGVNYGAKDWMAYLKKLHARRQLYADLLASGNYPNMRLATPNLNLDRYYGFPTGTRAVSSRNNTQEEYHTNFMHPNPSGYEQLGDAFFSAYLATLNE